MKRALPIFIGGAVLAAAALLAVFHWKGGDMPTGLSAVKKAVEAVAGKSGSAPDAGAAGPDGASGMAASSGKKSAEKSGTGAAGTGGVKSAERTTGNRPATGGGSAVPAKTDDRPATGSAGTGTGGAEGGKAVAVAGKETAERKPAPAPEEKAVAPTFDIVRVDSSGSVVIAGRGGVGSRVQILLDGRVIGEVAADGRGEWVYVPDKALPPGPHEMAVRTMSGGKALMSRQTVTLTVPGKKDEKALVVLAEPDKPSRILQEPEADGMRKAEAAGGGEAVGKPRKDEKGTEAAAGGAAEKTEGEKAAARTKVASAPAKESGTPGKAAEAAPGRKKASIPLSLRTVDYDESGDIFFTGRARPGQVIRLYVDNRFLGDATADERGDWSWKGKSGIAPGVHRLRVDRITRDGKVVERIELPFMRADVAQVAQLRAQAEKETLEEKKEARRPAPESGASRDAAVSTMENGATEKTESEKGMAGREFRQHPARVIIQPGDNLWTIARHLYGRGIRYTVIYEANRDQIRDPDLIYPGQVFATPKVEQER